MADRVSSFDIGYTSGDLSLFPQAIDNRTSLYEATNNAKAPLKFGLPYNGKKIIVQDATMFPANGLVRIGPESGEGNFELVYYASRTNNTFNELIRGFAGSIQTTWDAGAWVTNAVMAEHHNAVKDALLNIEKYLGLKDYPDETSLNGIIKQLETRFLSPKADFRAFPKAGAPPLTVRFQNLSGEHCIRYFWDFGDGTHSIERSPTHTYTSEGYYSVKLIIYTSIGGQGIKAKNNYIKVSEEERPGFFYIVLANPTAPAYSVDTATVLGKDPGIFNFVDQTDGDIARRIWVFGDGTTEEIDDPDKHSTTHTYTAQGEYSPVLILVYADQMMRRIFHDPITVL